MNNRIIRENFEFYKNRVLGNCFIFVLNNDKAIVVKTKKTHLRHLLGIDYATKNHAYNGSGTSFYRDMELNRKDMDSLYYYIDEERDELNELTKDELFLKQKNIIFKDVFSDLLKKNCSLRIYKSMPGEIFNTDYLHVKVFNEDREVGYIGIKGCNKEDSFVFNSVFLDRGEKRENSIPINVKRVEIIKSDEYVNTAYDLVASPDNKTISNTMHKNKKAEIDRKTLNRINKVIFPYCIKRGCYGRRNYVLQKGKVPINEHFELEMKGKSESEIIVYVNNLK